jgi:hypothetical protein
MSKFSIELDCDGWIIYNLSTGKWYAWGHNEESLGTAAIGLLLEDLGHEVSIEEIS